MKKFLGLSLCALMVLTGCSNGGGGRSNVYTTFYPTDVQSLDYVTTALAVDHEINANLVDGLLENDRYGHFVGALAESWEANEDSSVWTFKLREGVKWVTSTGEEYAEVTAQDFVTGLQHAADFESGTAWLLEGVVENFLEYEKGLVEFAEVGVKALDDYTVQYTLTGPTPYFFSMTTYAILYPVNEQFLTAQGVGCALGAPDKETCSFGSVSPDSILYNGGFILTANDAKSVQELTKNEAYWDVENIKVDKVVRMFDDGSDVYAVIKGFEQGTYDRASLLPTWEDFDDYKEKYKDNYRVTLPNSTVFGINFNYNRQAYEYTSHTTDADKANTKAAILNDNFRKAVRAAYDRVAYLSVSSPEDVAVEMLRNINNFPEVVLNSEGKTYGTLVTEAYQELTGEKIDLADAQDPFLDPAAAMKYIEAAKAEGINFPITLDVLAIGDSSPVYVNRANSMKESVERNSQGNIIINVILEPQDTVQAICYFNTDPAKTDYDINTFSGWSPDYADPKSFVDVYSTTSGYYMHVIGLALAGDGDATSLAIQEEAGWNEYEALYRAADAIVDDLDARYAAFAKADAYMVSRALFIPQQQQLRGYLVTKEVPFTQCYSTTGISEYKFKGLEVQEDIVTREQYETAKAEWDANR